MKSVLKKSFLILLLFLVICEIGFTQEMPKFEFRKASRPVHTNMGRYGGVASGGPMGPSAGLKVLMDGGNAIDAAVTAAAMSTVTQFNMSNIGGHGGMIIYLAKTKEVKFLDWGGHLPAAFSIDQWGNPPVAPPSRSVFNTILPGTLKGWAVALETYGTISLAKALEPAIKYAEEGFPVYPGLAARMEADKDEIELYPEYKKVVFPEGRPPRVGEILRFPDYANTLKMIAKQGPDLFYKGELARKIVAFLNENDSRFTLEEFANFQPRWVDLLKTTYRGEYEIYVPKNQNFSPVILTMFNVWENFDLPNMHPLSPDTLHLIAEVSKIGLNDRVYYGDPAQSNIPYEILISKRYAKAIADRIRMDSVLPDKPAGDITGLLRSPLAFSNETRDMDRYRSTTTSIAAVDKEGNVALITQTIGAGNGSMHIVPGTGIILNNEGVYFDLVPKNGPNYPAPGRKVENQMGGAIVLRGGKFYAGAATPTGWQIPLQIAQVLMRVLDHKLNIQEAIELPRLGYLGSGRLRVEEDIPEFVRNELIKRGHTLQIRMPTFGMVGVFIDPVSGARVVGGDPVWLPTHSVAY